MVFAHSKMAKWKIPLDHDISESYYIGLCQPTAADFAISIQAIALEAGIDVVSEQEYLFG